MIDAFGDRPIAVVQAAVPRGPQADMDLVRDGVAGLARGGAAELNIARPLPTAAFSRRDALRPGYRAAEASVSVHGFSSVLRPVGGHLAVYGEGALVLHLWAPHIEPRTHIRARFQLLGGALAKALRTVGADARVGPVPGEYCDGEFSVNDAGRAKLAGTGQRITRAGYLFSAVVMVHDVGPARAALTEAYAKLGLAFWAETVGCVADSVPGITTDEVREQLVATLGTVLTIAPAQVSAG